MTEADIIDHLATEITKTPRFFPHDFVKNLSDSITKNRPLLKQFISSIAENQTGALPKACQQYAESLGTAFAKAVSSETERDLAKKATQEMKNIQTAVKDLFNDASLDKRVKTALTSGLTQGLGKMTIPPLSAKQPFSPKMLTDSLSQFVRTTETLLSLAKGLGIEEETNHAVQQVVAGNCTQIRDKIITYSHPGKVFDFDNLKECLEKMSRWPACIQIPILVAVREELKTNRRLPKELDPPFQEDSPINNLPKLARDIFVYSWVKTIEHWETTRPATGQLSDPSLPGDKP
jgi:hypothetical protein